MAFQSVQAAAGVAASAATSAIVGFISPFLQVTWNAVIEVDLEGLSFNLGQYEKKRLRRIGPKNFQSIDVVPIVAVEPPHRVLVVHGGEVVRGVGLTQIPVVEGKIGIVQLTYSIFDPIDVLKNNVARWVGAQGDFR